MMVMQNNYHNVRLEWIVIWLIVVEVVVGESGLSQLEHFGLPCFTVSVQALMHTASRQHTSCVHAVCGRSTTGVCNSDITPGCMHSMQACLSFLASLELSLRSRGHD
jgi:hypothetical protein